MKLSKKKVQDEEEERKKRLLRGKIACQFFGTRKKGNQIWRTDQVLFELSFDEILMRLNAG